MDASQADSGIAHLFEHLVVGNFCLELEKDGHVDGLWGWVEGEAYYSKQIKISAGFYDRSARKRFLEYISQPIEINKCTVLREIKRIEAENYSKIDCDMDSIILELNKLNQKKFVSLNGKNDVVFHHEKPVLTRPKSKFLVEKRDKPRFQDFNVRIGIKKPSKLEKELFLRLSVLMSDITGEVLNRKFWAYEHGHIGVAFDPNGMGEIFRYSIYPVRKNDYRQKAISQELTKRIRSISFSVMRKQLKKFISGYYRGDLNNDFPFDYYQDSGVLASKYHIYKLFTPKNVQNVWSKLSVEIKKI
jgi:hypothetical protein